MSVLLLAAGLVLALLLVPLGLPGLWAMLGVALLYDVVSATPAIGAWTLVGAALLAGVAEVIEFLLGGSFARRYGGSRRAGWGAILGGLAGAVIGVPVPVLGPMLGGFVGAFLGALAAIAVKVGIGFVILVWLLVAAWQ